MSIAVLRNLLKQGGKGKVNVPGVGMRARSTVQGYIRDPKKYAAAAKHSKASVKRVAPKSGKSSISKKFTAEENKLASGLLKNARAVKRENEASIKRFIKRMSDANEKAASEIKRIEAKLKTGTLRAATPTGRRRKFKDYEKFAKWQQDRSSAQKYLQDLKKNGPLAFGPDNKGTQRLIDRMRREVKAADQIIANPRAAAQRALQSRAYGLTASAT